MQGIVYRFVDTPSVAAVKEILEVVDEEPVLTQPQLALAKEMGDSTLQPLASIVGLFLPAGLNQQAEVVYSLREPKTSDQRAKTDPTLINSQTKKLTTEDRILNLLRLRGPLRGRQIDAHFAKLDWRKTAGFLVRKGVLASKSIWPRPRVRTKYIRVAQLAVPPEAAEAAMESLVRKDTCCDRYLYEITVTIGGHSKTVRTIDASPTAPAALTQLVDTLNQLVATPSRGAS